MENEGQVESVSFSHNIRYCMNLPQAFGKLRLHRFILIFHKLHHIKRGLLKKKDTKWIKSVIWLKIGKRNPMVG